MVKCSHHNITNTHKTNWFPLSLLFMSSASITISVYAETSNIGGPNITYINSYYLLSFRFSEGQDQRYEYPRNEERWGDLYQSGRELFAAYVSHKRRLQVYNRLVNSLGNLSSQVKLLTSRFRVNWVFLKESSNNLFCNGTARTVVTQNEATKISPVRFSCIQQHSKNQGEYSLYSIKNTVVSLQIKST